MDQLIFHHIMRAKSIARKLSNGNNNNIDNISNDVDESNEKTRLLNSFLKSRGKTTFFHFTMKIYLEESAFNFVIWICSKPKKLNFFSP